MRVLTVTNLYPPDVIGGYELACQQMVGALRDRGHDVMVLTSHPRSAVPESEGVVRRLRFNDWQLRPDRVRGSDDLRRVMTVQAQVIDAANVGALIECLREFSPDVVYLWNTAFIGGLGVAGALAHLQVPVVWHFMDAVPNAAVTVDGQIAMEIASVLSRRLRARYIACSQRLADEIGRSGFAIEDRLTLLPNWVDPTPTHDRRLWYPDVPALRIVAAGQLAPHKGFDVIVEAARLLLDSGRAGFFMDFYGTGLEDRYWNMILAGGLESHVRLGGSLERTELLRRYKEYDIFLFPTWSREPFAFAPLEAAACGCVPVISRDCGNAEWVVDGVHALKVARTPEAVAAVIGDVLDRRLQIEPIGRRARRMVCNSFALAPLAGRVERELLAAQELRALSGGEMPHAYNLARLAEQLALDWAQQRA